MRSVSQWLISGTNDRLSLLIWTGCVLVLDHLLGFVSDGDVDLQERLLGGEKVVFRQELPTLFGKTVEFPGVALPALVVVQGDLLDDAGVDELLNVLVDGGIAHAGIELLEFVHRGQLVGVLEDIIDQREPRLLGDPRRPPEARAEPTSPVVGGVRPAPRGR